MSNQAWFVGPWVQVVSVVAAVVAGSLASSQNCPIWS
jgi:hypothetical protein